eukprot:m.362571 g.362571  ORF g.362571 m.362571 type:complete len:86 (+) comp20645_c0_seq1:961-1218(+)
MVSNRDMCACVCYLSRLHTVVGSQAYAHYCFVHVSLLTCHFAELGTMSGQISTVQTLSTTTVYAHMHIALSVPAFCLHAFIFRLG